MRTAKILAGEALSPMLEVFHSISGQILASARKVETEGSVDRLVLGFGAVTLVISADENDDTVNITLSETPDLAGLDISHLEPWRNLTGRPFGWGWVTVNQQGYCDGLLLSFGGIVPLLALNVIASSIKVGVITMVAQ